MLWKHSSPSMFFFSFTFRIKKSYLHCGLQIWCGLAPAVIPRPPSQWPHGPLILHSDHTSLFPVPDTGPVCPTIGIVAMQFPLHSVLFHPSCLVNVCTSSSSPPHHHFLRQAFSSKSNMQWLALGGPWPLRTTLGSTVQIVTMWMAPPWAAHSADLQVRGWARGGEGFIGVGYSIHITG